MIDQFTDLKEWVVGLTGLSKDALHVHVSLILMFTISVAARRPLASWLPWTAALAFELANEALDYLSDPLASDWREAAAHDLFNTMLWPTLLALVIILRKVRLR